MLTMIAAINEFERANLLERQKEGIAIAKRKGIYKGRKAVSIPDFKAYYNRYLQREISKSELAKELQISRPTLDKQINLYLEAGYNRGLLCRAFFFCYNETCCYTILFSWGVRCIYDSYVEKRVWQQVY